MSASRSAMRSKLLLPAVLGIVAGLCLGAVGNPAGEPEKYAVRRTVEREGRAWVERSELSAPVREGGRLVLRADFGSVVVKTGASDKLQCQVILRAYTSSESVARHYLVGYQLAARALEAGGVYVSGKGPGEENQPRWLEAEFDVTVPARFNLDIESKGGDIHVQSPLQGEVRATTAGGEIHTQDVSGPVRAETAVGSIALGNVSGRVDARTAGGNIRVGNVAGEATLETSGGEIVAGRVGGHVRAATAGGDVVIGGAGGQVFAQTAGGQIRVGPSGSSVRVETAGGSVWLGGARGRVDVDTAGGSINLFALRDAVRASTGAGRIRAQIDGSRGTFGASELEDSMGDVEVLLPADLVLTIDALIRNAAGYAITSDFPLTIQASDGEYSRREIRGRGTINGGGQVLRIRTVNGNIAIRKLNAQLLEQLRQQQNMEWKRLEGPGTEKEQ